MLLESTHFKAPDGSEKKDQIGLSTFFPIDPSYKRVEIHVGVCKFFLS
jgi:hypothetical protein